MDMPTVGIIDFADGCPSASGLKAAYADGIRVGAGYRGSTDWKKLTPTVRDRLRAAGYGIAAMFEADDPPRGYFRALLGAAAGAADAKAARADWRSIGYPDSGLIAWAFDGNTDKSHYPAIAAYAKAFRDADTCLPWAYIEPDIGELLYADGLIGGIFAPAAYSWDPAGKDGWNRPHVFWIQQHNGVTTWGGDVDRGVIRADANIWWPPGHTGHVMGEPEMELTDKVTLFDKPDVTYSSPEVSVETILASTNYYTLQTRNQLNTKLDTVIDMLGDSAKVEQAITAALAATGATVDRATLTGALVDALKQLAADDDTPAA